MEMKSIKVNLFGGPGSGKSTVAALVYAYLKLRKINCELVREFAKDLVYQGKDLKKSTTTEQAMIFQEQKRRELILKDQVQVILCDSPLYLNAFYSGLETLWEASKEYSGPNDLNIFIKRNQEESFESVGRSHDETQSKAIDVQMREELLKRNIPFIEFKGEAEEKAMAIVNIIIKKIGNIKS